MYSVILRQRSRCTRDIEIVQTCTVLTKEGARRSTRQIEFCINFSRHSEALRAERIQPIMVDGGQEVRRSGWYNKRTLTNYTNIVLNENSLPSCPLNFRSSDNQPFTLHHSLKRNAAFTLAEVLITLGIIGVVAALTMPSLIANHKYKVLQIQFKKAYSELNEVARMFYNDNEISVPEYVAGGNINKFLSQLPKYLKGISVIDDWNYNDTDENNSYLTTMPYPVHDIKGNNEVKLHCDNYGFRADISGRIYTFNDAPQSGINGPTVCVDINGEKNPNRYGIDIFLFVFTTDGFVIPMGQEHKNNSVTTTSGGNSAFVPASEYCRQTTDPVRQYSCAYFALADKNPEGNGDYWNDFLKNKK